MLKVYIKLSLFIALINSVYYIVANYLKNNGVLIPLYFELVMDCLWAIFIFFYFIRLMFLYTNDYSESMEVKGEEV